jgi:protein-disulfide isomerase
MNSIDLRGRSILRHLVRLAVWAAVAPGSATLILFTVFGASSGAAFAVTQAGTSTTAANGGPATVLATIGNHAVTQAEVDNKVAAQLYDLRKQALDNIIDDYLLQRAASKAGLKTDEYVNRQLKSSNAPVTAHDAEQFYGEHKAQLDAQTGGHSFSEIKPRLIAALQHQQDRDAQQQLIQKLRKENHVTVLLQAPRVNVASAGHPTSGGSSAPVTIIEFSDFQCPFCRAAEGALKQVREKYGEQLKLVYMDFPLGFHPHAMDAARAARCAADQDKFWQFHDALFLDQKKLDPDNLQQTAAKVGLDHNKFNACFSSDKHDAGIRADMAQGNSLGVTGTPTFFINGRELVGAQPPAKFNEIIDDELARAQPAANSRQARK